MERLKQDLRQTLKSDDMLGLLLQLSNNVIKKIIPGWFFHQIFKEVTEYL